MRNMTRQTLGLLAISALLAGCGAVGTSSQSAGTSKEAKILVLVPLSGPYAEHGKLIQDGAQMAADEINKKGGIASLHGAKVELEVRDAGSTVETAVSTARSALNKGDVVAGTGSFLSSYTLGVINVATKAKVPWVTMSSSPTITASGSEYVFQDVVPTTDWAPAAYDFVKKSCDVKRIAFVGDNTASPKAWFDAWSTVAKQNNLSIVQQSIWTPPLTDASPIAQQLATSGAQLIVFGTTTSADSTAVLGQMKARGIKAPIIGNGSPLLVPSYLDQVGEQNIDGILAVDGANPTARQKALEETFKKRTGQPFMQQEGLLGYAQVWMIADAVQKAASTNPTKVAEALHALDERTGPAADAMPGGVVAFDKTGALKSGSPVIAQWQQGVPVTVYPQDVATHQASIQCVQ